MRKFQYPIADRRQPLTFDHSLYSLRCHLLAKYSLHCRQVRRAECFLKIGHLVRCLALFCHDVLLTCG